MKAQQIGSTQGVEAFDRCGYSRFFDRIEELANRATTGFMSERDAAMTQFLLFKDTRARTLRSGVRVVPLDANRNVYLSVGDFAYLCKRQGMDELWTFIGRI